SPIPRSRRWSRARAGPAVSPRMSPRWTSTSPPRSGATSGAAARWRLPHRCRSTTEPRKPKRRLSARESMTLAEPIEQGERMGNAIGELFPLAVALACGPLPIIALVLILVSNDARANGIGFVIGRIGGLAAIVAVTLVILSLIGDPSFGHSGHPAPAVS